MEYTRIGSSGLQVSRLCLGTMTFGLQCDEETSIAIMDSAAEAGITFVDTADVYPSGGSLETVGRTEEIVGRWLKGRRDRFILATKCWARMGPQPWDQGSSRRHILDAVDASLRRLQTDYIDLYQLHRPDPETPIDETLQALDDLIRMGKVRYVGCSNFLAYQLARALGRSEVTGTARFISVQPRYNLLFRRAEPELLPLCAEERIGVIPYNPLAGGMLTGKHRLGKPREGTRFTLGSAAASYRERYWHQRAFETVGQVQEIAGAAGLPMTTLAVAWVLARPEVSSAIIGASAPRQLEASLVAAETRLPADVLERLDRLTEEYRLGPVAP